MKRITLIALSLMSVFAVAISLTTHGFAGKEEMEQTASSRDNKIENKQINIENFSFTPPTLTIPAGTKVTWVNHDDIPHLVVSTDKRFASPPLDTDDSFSYSFTAPGTYEYYCSIHPKMTAKIIVRQ